MTSIPVLQSIADLAKTSDAWFVDIWGVMHNGVRPFASAVAACQAFRKSGGTIILVSNSPRPGPGVIAQLNQVGVADDAYNAVVTSGDVSRHAIAALPSPRILHIGPARDMPIFNGLAAERVDVAAADAIVCTGLHDDETETAETYRSLLESCASRFLPMICANPDMYVERGGRLIPCAGAVAKLYEDLGQPVIYAGKPHRPIYEAAMQRLTALRGGPVSLDRILAIGDGVATDIEGAARFGLRSVFIASGLHVQPGEDLDDVVTELFANTSRPPIGAMSALAQ
jgi:HAD superfamily hydrolase (TIGR01459 family)